MGKGFSVKRQPVVVVGTPGKLMDHAMEGTMASWGVRHATCHPTKAIVSYFVMFGCPPSLLLIYLGNGSRLCWDC